MKTGEKTLPGEAEVDTPEDIERVYKIPKSTQAYLRMRGTFIPYFRVGRKVRYFKRDTHAYFSAQRRLGTRTPMPAPQPAAA